MKLKRISNTVDKQTIYDALSDLPDAKVSDVAISLRHRFAKATFKNLLGMTVTKAQRKVFK